MKKIQCLAGALVIASLLTFSACNEKEKEVAPVTPEPRPACVPTKFTLRSSSPDGFQPTEYNFEYDADHKPVKATIYEDGTLRGYSTFEYSATGHLARMDWYHDSAPDGYATFEYNAQGQVIQSTEYDSKNMVRSSIAYEYDVSSGNRTQATFREINSGVEHVSTIRYEYANGNLVKRTTNRGAAYDQVMLYEYHLDKKDPMKPYMDGPLGLYLFSFTSINDEEPTFSNNVNLLKKQTCIWNTTDVNYNRVQEITYQFNDRGFPTNTSVKRTDPDPFGSSQRDLATEYACQ